MKHSICGLLSVFSHTVHCFLLSVCAHTSMHVYMHTWGGARVSATPGVIPQVPSIFVLIQSLTCWSSPSRLEQLLRETRAPPSLPRQCSQACSQGLNSSPLSTLAFSSPPLRHYYHVHCLKGYDRIAQAGLNLCSPCHRFLHPGLMDQCPTPGQHGVFKVHSDHSLPAPNSLFHRQVSRQHLFCLTIYQLLDI